GILPTPTIGAVGLIAGPELLIDGQAQDGHIAILIGEGVGHMGQSAVLAEMFARADGDAPGVDLAREKRHGEFIRASHRLIGAACDLSDGGLALAAFEMAEAGNVGVTIDAATTAALFGEDQARYLLACAPDQATELLANAAACGVPACRIGSFGGAQIRFGAASAPLAELSRIFHSSFAGSVA
ncbi:MAG: AIR synthase-related protein, partial [Paracoccaceae bacterium]